MRVHLHAPIQSTDATKTKNGTATAKISNKSKSTKTTISATDRWKEQLDSGCSYEDLFAAVWQHACQLMTDAQKPQARELALRWFAFVWTCCHDNLTASFSKQDSKLVDFLKHLSGVQVGNLPQASQELQQTIISCSRKSFWCRNESSIEVGR